MPVFYWISTFNKFFCKSKTIISTILSQIRYNCPKNWWFLVKMGKNGPNFRFKLKKSRCIAKNEKFKYLYQIKLVPSKNIDAFKLFAKIGSHAHFELQQLYSQWQEKKESHIKPVTVKKLKCSPHIWDCMDIYSCLHD